MDEEKPDSPVTQAAEAQENEASRWNDCLKRIAENRDRQAFRELFKHFAPLIKSFAYKVPSINQNEAFADELVQETMLKVWIKADSFDPSRASAGTWIFTIARNTRIDLLRKYSRHDSNAVSPEELGETVDAQDIWFEDMDTDIFEDLAEERDKQAVHLSLKDLPPEQSEILEKVYLEDKSHSEVAEELSLPLGTVKSRVRLALKKLRIAIDK